MPRASSRSSSSACASSSRAPAMIAAVRSGSVASFDSARRSETESATRRCWAPSWRSRSRRRRASSPAATRRARDARSSSSRRRRSVTSAPVTSTMRSPRTSVTRCAVQATIRSVPSCTRHTDSSSAGDAPSAASAIAARAASAVHRRTPTRRGCARSAPPDAPNVSPKARSSRPGADAFAVDGDEIAGDRVGDRVDERAAAVRPAGSFALRAVTSTPDTSTSPSVRPVTSATGAALHSKVTRSPSARSQSDS